MGSVKDEVTSPVEDCQHCEKTDDGKCLSSADAIPAPAVFPTNASLGDRQPEVYLTVGEEVEGPASRGPALSLGIFADTDDAGSPYVTKSCSPTDTNPPEQPPDATTPACTDDLSRANTHTMSTQSPPSHASSCDPVDRGNEGQGGGSVDEDLKGGGVEDRDEVGGVEPPAFSSLDPPVPCSPAPPGQQHVHTQVSLEVVQCHSVATSPMTPPGGEQTFLFPQRTGKSKDEFRSVATAPMTPRTPTAPAFPNFAERELGRVEVKVEMGEKGQRQGQTHYVQQGLCTMTTGVVAEGASCATVEEVAAEQCIESKEVRAFNSNTLTETTSTCPSIPLVNLQVTVEDNQQQCKAQTQRIGSMDQDITILVTQHDSGEARDELEEEETGSSICVTGDLQESNSEADVEAGKAIKEAEEKCIESHDPGPSNTGKISDDVKNKSTPNSQQSKILIEGPSIIFHDNTKTEKDPNKKSSTSMVGGAKEEPCLSDTPTDVAKEACSPIKTSAPSSPAATRCHHMYTQVSLEVVQCHSAATSPMTPPEGGNDFFFPNSCGRSPAMGTESKDAELHVDRQVEVCSVATAPMTPNTPTAPTGPPEIRKEEREEGKVSEDVDDRGKGEAMATVQPVDNEGESLEESRTIEAIEVDGGGEEKAERKRKEGSEEKFEEPVQEVSWDEKGMTWEVYGAVVEVAVLGSAIQKHLEKQVKKHKQPLLPPPPPLSPSAIPLPSTSELTSDSAQVGSGKGRAGKRGERGGKAGRRGRNPFRLLLRNMQQPRCCSRAHSAE